jgi:hypothetical protein
MIYCENNYGKKLLVAFIFTMLFVCSNIYAQTAPQLAIDLDPSTEGIQDQIVGSVGYVSYDIYALDILNIDSYDITLSYTAIEGNVGYFTFVEADFDCGDQFPEEGCSSIHIVSILAETSREITESITGTSEICAPDGDVHLCSVVFNVTSVEENTIIEISLGGTLVTVEGTEYFPDDISSQVLGIVTPTGESSWGAIKSMYSE